MSLLVQNWADKQLDELADLLATGDFSQVASFISQNFLCQGSRILYGGTQADHSIDDVELKVTPHLVTSVETGAVDISAGVFQNNGLLSQLDSTQIINILDDTYGSWGSGQAADGSKNRWDIICVKNAEQALSPADRWFVDDSVSPNTYSQISTNTKINKAYYDIQVAHGSNVSGTTYDASNPTIPTGYFVIAEIYVPHGATTITAANIYDTTKVSNASTPNWDDHTRVLRMEFFADEVATFSKFAVDHDASTGYHRNGFHIGSDACGATVTAPNLNKLTNGATLGLGELHTHGSTLAFIPRSIRLINANAAFSWLDVDVTAYVPAGATQVYVQMETFLAAYPTVSNQCICHYNLRKKGTSPTYMPRLVNRAEMSGALGWWSPSSGSGAFFVGIDTNHKFQAEWVVDSGSYDTGVTSASYFIVDLLGYGY